MEVLKHTEFTGWAVIELLGHRKIAGFVKTVAFGSTVMFHVSVPGQAAVEQVIETPTYVSGYGHLPAQTKISVSRDEFQQFVGVGSVYALTPCSEERALGCIPTKVVDLKHCSRGQKTTISPSKEHPLWHPIFHLRTIPLRHCIA